MSGSLLLSLCIWYNEEQLVCLSIVWVHCFNTRLDIGDIESSEPLSDVIALTTWAKWCRKRILYGLMVPVKTDRDKLSLKYWFEHKSDMKHKTRQHTCIIIMIIWNDLSLQKTEELGFYFEDFYFEDFFNVKKCRIGEITRHLYMVVSATTNKQCHFLKWPKVIRNAALNTKNTNTA